MGGGSKPRAVPSRAVPLGCTIKGCTITGCTITPWRAEGILLSRQYMYWGRELNVVGK